MGVSEVFFWSWALLLLHAVAYAQPGAIRESGGGQRNMIVVGSTTVPNDECTQLCLRIVEAGERPGANIRKCRKRCTGAEDLSSFFNDTFFDPRDSNDDGDILTAQNGSSVTLKCAVANRGDAPVKWSVTPKRGDGVSTVAHDVVNDGKLMIRVDKSYQLEGDYNRTFHLKINPVRPRHAGIYSCQVYLETRYTPLQFSVELVVNVAASIQKIKATGLAKPRIPKNPKPVLKLFYNETDRVELFCIASGMPTPNVTWRRPDGSTLSRLPTLVIDNITRADSGTYTCEASNFPGPTAEKNVEIIVQYQPKVRVRKADIREPEGEYVMLECLVDAKPRAEYRWIKDNRTIKNDEAAIDQNPKSTKLIIISLNPDSDYGEYYCEATNLLGTATGIVNVTGKPRKPTILSDPVGNRKHRFNLIWNHGESGRRDDPRSIEVTSYEIQYYGWYTEISGNKQRLIFTHGDQQTHDPYKEHVDVTPGQYRMSFILDDLRDNATYNVSLFGINRYGDGEITRFKFCTSSVPKNQSKGTACTPGSTYVYAMDEATVSSERNVSGGNEDPEFFPTTEATPKDILPSPQADQQTKCWPEGVCENSANKHTTHLCVHLLIIFLIGVLFL